MNKEIISLTTNQLKALCHEIQPFLPARVINCLGKTRSRFFLFLEKNHQRQSLFFSFAKPFVCFYLTSQKQDGSRDGFLKPFFIDLALEKVELINDDRIVRFVFSGNSKTHHFIAEFFPKHPNYYLTDAGGTILASLYPTKNAVYVAPQPGSHVTAKPLSFAEVEQLDLKAHFLHQKEIVQTMMRQQLERQQRFILKMEMEQEQASQWEAVQHEGELLKAHFAQLQKGLKEVTVLDWLTDQRVTLPLEPLKTPQEQIARRFKQAKKMARSLPHLQEQIDKGRQTIESIKKAIEVLDHISTIEPLMKFKEKWLPEQPKIEKQKQQVELPYYEFLSEAGIKIWVGKNAKKNDKLTFQHANGSDWWLHIQDFPGSHVIIKTKKGEPPDSETLQDALQLALQYSKAKDQKEGQVCMTQRKFVSRLGRDQPGKVQISKHKTHFVRVDPIRLKRLKTPIHRP